MNFRVTKIPLPLYYLILLVIVAGVIFLIENRSQSPIQSTTVQNSSVSPSGLRQISDSKDLWVLADKVYFKYSCSYRDDLMLIPINYHDLHIYNENYFGDKNTLWNSNFTGCNPPTQVKLNPPADIASFSVISSDTNLAKDRFGLIGTISMPLKGAYGDKIQTSVRVSGLVDNNFNYISNNIIVDGGKVYSYNQTLASLSEIYQLPTDIKKIFESADLKSCLYFINSEKVYSYCPYSVVAIEKDHAKEIVGADPLTFHKLGVGQYWVDKGHVFLYQIPLVDASTTNFVALSDGYFFSNSHVYFGDKIITDATYSSEFHVINGQPSYNDGACGGDLYWTNGKDVFYHGKTLGADPNNLIFQFFPGFKCTATGYVWDWKNYFYAGNRIDTADPSSFRVIKNRYARDNYHVYEDGKIMPGDNDQLEKDILSGKIPKISDEDVMY